ncbi:CPBP family intramembrane glutamic endopeptidase [Halorubellus sp. PRR65]|uniref:CPBP family intramembrane glutamic endopeptidase n=1 Tax=Halorubellus sp. PRR65 TaxID=3098148 RepID=UPI002B25AD89|nr:CPBP family intramembrane glutamic endopeptidase [Halorubellus sp. PRR65]
MSVESREGWSPGRFVAAALAMAFVGAVGIFAIAVWQTVVYGLVTDVVWEPPLSGARQQILSTVALGLATTMTAGIYLTYTNRSLSFLDVRTPTLREVAWAVGGIVALFALLQVISVAFEAFGISTSQHSTTQAAASEPSLLLPLVPLSLLIIGPGEELLYRNVVQKALYEHAPRWMAVLTASVIFSLVHIPAYSTGGTTGQLVATLTVIFTLSLVLGTVYERTENLLVPAFVHGSYNAILFGFEYVEQTAGLVAPTLL